MVVDVRLQELPAQTHEQAPRYPREPDVRHGKVHLGDVFTRLYPVQRLGRVHFML